MRDADAVGHQGSDIASGEARLSRIDQVAVSGGICHRAGAPASTPTTFPLPAHQAHPAGFPRGVLVQDHAFAHAWLASRYTLGPAPAGSCLTRDTGEISNGSSATLKRQVLRTSTGGRSRFAIDSTDTHMACPGSLPLTGPVSV